MANELQIPWTATGKTLYCVLRNAVGQAVIASSGVVETYQTANLDNYDIPLTEQGTASQYYVGNIPAGLTAGVYFATVYERAGATPAEGDTFRGSGPVEWDGSALVPLSSLATAAAVGALSSDVSGISITVTPLAVTVSAGEVSGQDLVAYQYCGFSFLLTITDNNDAPIDLSGKTIKFVVHDLDSPTDEIFELSTGSGVTVTGASHNQLSIVSDSTHTQTAGTFAWFLKDATAASNAVPLGAGSFSIRESPPDA